MSLLENIRELSIEFATNAEKVDQSFAPPREQMEALAASGYFRAVADAGPSTRRHLLDLLSSGCGATTFLASQHEGACRRLFKAQHPLLEEAIAGKVWIGVCFAHLRRRPSPVTVQDIDQALLFSGQGPWFSGHGLMTRVILGGATKDGEFLMAQCRLDQPAIRLGVSPRLAVMNATATVPLTFQSLSVPTDEIVLRTNPIEMNLADMHSTVFQSARSLGVARATVPHLTNTAGQQVLLRIDRQHGKMDAWDENPDWPRATRLRVEAIQLANLAIQAALVCQGGRSHSLNHPVQRLVREASFYATTQLTQELRDEYLATLNSET